MVRVARGLASRGVSVVTFDFPYKAKKKGAPDPGPVLEAAFQSVWTSLAEEGRTALFAGGKSMGGRIASQVAGRDGFSPTAGGLVFLGYPLHPPGKPEQRRDRHLPNIRVPMLFLSGTRDPFGSPEEMKGLVAALPLATLHLIDDGDHSLVARKTLDPSGARLEHAMDLAAAWILETGR